MTLVELEHRVATLEEQVGHLTSKINAPAAKDINSWIDDIHGTFQDDATYRKAALAGATVRVPAHRFIPREEGRL